MPQEFLQYLEQERGEHPEDHPFLLELAHYEWLEIALSIDTREIDLSNIDQKGDLLEGIPVLNPISMALAYTWPVHEISPSNLLDTPPMKKPTLLSIEKKMMRLDLLCLIQYLQN